MKFKFFYLALVFALAPIVGCSGDSSKSKPSTSSTTTTTISQGETPDSGGSAGGGHHSGGGSGGSGGEPGEAAPQELAHTDFGQTVIAASSEDYDIVMQIGGTVSGFNVQSDSGDMSLSGVR